MASQFKGYLIVSDRQGGFDIYWPGPPKKELVASGFETIPEACDHVTELIEKLRDQILRPRQNISK